MRKQVVTMGLLALMLIVAAAPAHCEADHQREIDYGWSVWVKGEGYVDPAEWYGGELGDESVPLYALGGITVIAATGAVLMHRKRVRVG